MPAALILSLAQLADAAFLRVIVRSIGLTLLIFVGVAWCIWTQTANVDTKGWPAWLAEFWASGGGSVAGVLIALLLLWLSFTGIATAVASLWLDEIVAAVEARYYPAARATPLGFRRELAMGLRGGLRVLLWNALFVPLYIVLLVTGIGPLILFLAVNAWLLGRETLETVAARHVAGDAARQWPLTHTKERWATGLVTAGLFALPLTGLIAQIVGTAFATHLYHRDP